MATRRAVLLLLVLAGCGGGGKRLVGTWDVAMDQARASHIFRADGTYSISVGNADGTATDSGTYELNGDRLTQKSTRGFDLNAKLEWDGENAFVLRNVGGAVYRYQRRN